jgi:uncharacterized protein YndB with AHSA1/START domain
MKNERISDIAFSFSVPNTPQQCFRAWTTEEGLGSFLSRNVQIDLRPGGIFEVLFDMDSPEGSRGSEGMIVMAYEDDRMFSFTWNSPPSIPEIRPHMTMVTITFTPTDGGGTDIDFRNVGYGSGERWQQARSYFVRAWGEVVLPRFRAYLETGAPVWEDT